MTNAKNTKRALLSSVLALFLCFSMLLGTTYAWFTDSVTSANNIIKSGNLDIELEYAKVVDGDITEWDTVAGKDNIFDKNALWEPGRVEVVYLKVSNLGTLALKYQLGVNIVNEIGGKNVAGEDFKLSDHLVFKVVDLATEPATAYTREEAVAAAGNVKGLKDYYSDTTALEVGGTDYVALIVYMPENVGNEANYRGDAIPTITLGINLYATQQMSEKDSFNDQYDKDAWHPDFTVTSVEDLEAALANGGKIQVNGTLNAGATQDVPNWTNAPAEFIFDATTLDALKGGKYVLEQGSRYGIVGLISAGESLALSDMEITANSQWPVYLSNYGGTLTLEDIDVTATQGAGIYPYGTNGTTTIKSATVNQKALSDEFASSTPWAGTAIATSNGHNLIIEDGTYIGSTWGVYVYNSGANVTINGGTFKAPKVIQADGVWSTGGNKSVVTVNDGNFDGALYLDWGTTPPEIYINGGNFTNFSATVNGAAKLVIKGGTFDADPSAYVAAGYHALQAGGTYFVVPNGISNVVTSRAELQAALDAATGDTTIIMAADITGDVIVSQKEGVNITIDGQNYNYDGTIYVYGNSRNTGAETLTIKNINFVTTSNVDRDFIHSYGDNTKIEQRYAHNVTIDNCTFTNNGNGTVVPARFRQAYNITIKNCTVKGTFSPLWTTGVEGLTIQNVTANCANEGMTIGASNNVLIENCTITVPGENSFGIRTDATNNYKLTVNNCKLNVATPIVIRGSSDTYTVIVDGAVQKAATSQSELNSAVSSDDKVAVELAAGNYTLPSAVAGKEVTISGSEDTVIDVTNSINMGSGDLVFDGVTVKSNGGGFNNGIQHVDTIVYQDATIVGSRSLYGNKEVFINCTFDLTGVTDYIWVYGANEAEFINCTFNTNGKALLIYNEGDGDCKVTVKGCTFNATTGAKAGEINNQNCAAIEINNFANSGVGLNHTLITEGNTIDGDFSGEWRIKNFVAGGVVTVNGAQYTQTALDGALMTVTNKVATLD